MTLPALAKHTRSSSEIGLGQYPWYYIVYSGLMGLGL